MSSSDTSEDDGPSKTNSNIRLIEVLLEDIDATWVGEGRHSRSEFIREALRDAVRYSELTRQSWKEIVAIEHAHRTSESETFSREEILGNDG